MSLCLYTSTCTLMQSTVISWLFLSFKTHIYWMCICSEMLVSVRKYKTKLTETSKCPRQSRTAHQNVTIEVYFQVNCFPQFLLMSIERTAVFIGTARNVIWICRANKVLCCGNLSLCTSKLSERKHNGKSQTKKKPREICRILAEKSASSPYS